MILAWLLSAVALGVVICIGGSCLAHLVARMGWPRRWVTLALMSVSLLLPAALAFETRPAPVTTGLDSAPVQPADRLLSASPQPVDTNTVVLITWATLSLALLGVLALSHRRAIRELAVCQQRDVLGHMVAVSPEFGPAAVGLLRARVVLPEWVLDLPPDELQLVLRHELEHVRAGDHLLLLAGVAMTVLMPWNAALWWQLRRLRVAMELDCDARVTPLLRDRPRYAQLLLRARSPRPAHRMVLALVPAPSALAERLMALLDRARPSAARMAAWSISTVACAALATRVPVPSLAPLLAHAKPATPMVSPTQTAPIPASMPSTGDGSRKTVSLHRRSAPAAAIAAPQVAPHPRYDSLIPYVPSPPGVSRGERIGATGRGSYVGGGRGAPTAGAVRAISRDSTPH